MDDRELLRQYVEERSDDAIDALIRRHVDMVYAVSLRELRDPQLAEDVTQAVFLVLLRRAGSLTSSVVLAGWLFNVARYAVADVRKQQLRRRHHEREAARMTPATGQDDAESAWQQMVPLLNDAVASLPAKDRDAVVMKYLEGKSHREVAEALRTTENAARQRIFRAVGSLRSFFRRRGVVMTESTVGAALVHAVAGPAPAALGGQIGAMLQSPAAGASLSIAQGVIQMMKVAKVKVAAVVCVTVMALGGAVGVLVYAAAGGADAKAGVGQGLAGVATSQPGTQPATQPAVELTPRQLVVAGYRAALAGDEQKFLQIFDTLQPEQEAKLKQVLRAMAALESLRQAIIAQFGEEAVEQLGLVVGLGVKESDLLEAKETVTGNSAVVDLGEVGPGKIPLVKVGGKWKVSGAMDMPGNLDELEQLLPLIRKLITEIKDGKYKTIEELKKGIGGMQ